MQICDLVYEVLGWWLYVRWFDGSKDSMEDVDLFAEIIL